MLRRGNARSISQTISHSICCHRKHSTKFQVRPAELGSIQDISDGFFHQRKFSMSNDQIPQGLADESFISTYSSLDGKVYTYATVVLKSMRNGNSVASSAWSHACSLTAPNLPSCAVAFVSKPTVAAVETIKELAHYMSNACNAEILARARSGDAQDANLSKDFEDCRVLDKTVVTSGGLASHPSMAPIIGCVAEGLAGDGRKNLAGRKCGGEDKGIKISRSRLVENGSLHMQCGPFFDQGCIDSEVSAAGLLASAANSMFCSQGSIKEEDEDEGNDDLGSLADWEHMVREYDEWKAKHCGLDSDSADSDEGSLPDVSANETDKYERVRRYRERFIMLKGLSDPATAHKLDNHESEVGNRKFTSRDLEEKKWTQKKALNLGNLLDWNKREDWIAQQVESIPKTVPGKTGIHVEDSSKLEIEACTRPQSEGRETKSGIQSKKNEEITSDEGQYELILCVAHLPGARVIPFYSSTTGVPNLPDLEIAVTTNNPHMLLLAAPGFPFSKFVQRLSTIFPMSGRAGAFMAPLCTEVKHSRAKMCEQVSALIFAGMKESTLGVVGLSISSEGLGVKVPIEAFAEFVRCSLGLVRIDGHTFLDNDISKFLFHPENVILEHSMFWQGTPSVDPILVLQQLDSCLMRHGSTSGIPISSAVRNTKTEKLREIQDLGENVGACLRRIEKVSKKQSKLHESLDLKMSSIHDDKFRQHDILPLALFDAVLFPGWSMPFYIYEHCYKLMVKHCLERGKPFGLSTIWQSDPIDYEDIVGTVANLKVYKFERNYNSFIVAHGVRRFRSSSERTWSQLGSFGLNIGEVHYFDDTEIESLTEKEKVSRLANHVVSLCRKIVPEANLSPSFLCLDDPMVASFAIGHVLPVPVSVKRRWLSMINTKDRLLEQLTFLHS